MSHTGNGRDFTNKTSSNEVASREKQDKENQQSILTCLVVCSRCRKYGHNRRTCNDRIDEEIVECDVVDEDISNPN